MKKKALKIIVFLLLSVSLYESALGDDGKRTQPTFNDGDSKVNQEGRVHDFIESLGDLSLSRRARGCDGGALGSSHSPKKKSEDPLSYILDLRLPSIDEHCIKDIGYEIYRLAYLYRSGAAGSEENLRMLAVKISQKKPSEMKAVAPQCRSALKGLAHAILRIYLGENWQPDSSQGGGDKNESPSEEGRGEREEGGRVDFRKEEGASRANTFRGRSVLED